MGSSLEHFTLINKNPSLFFKFAVPVLPYWWCVVATVILLHDFFFSCSAESRTSLLMTLAAICKSNEYRMGYSVLYFLDFLVWCGPFDLTWNQTDFILLLCISVSPVGNHSGRSWQHQHKIDTAPEIYWKIRIKTGNILECGAHSESIVIIKTWLRLKVFKKKSGCISWWCTQILHKGATIAPVWSTFDTCVAFLLLFWNRLAANMCILLNVSQIELWEERKSFTRLCLNLILMKFLFTTDTTDLKFSSEWKHCSSPCSVPEWCLSAVWKSPLLNHYLRVVFSTKISSITAQKLNM